MNERLADLENDIGFLKALAVEGRSATLIGGSILIAAGTTFGLASLGQWAALSGFLPRFSGWIYPAIWLASMIAFVAEFVILRRRLSPHKSADPANRAVGVAWSGAGFSIFTLFVSAAIIAWRTGSDVALMMLPSIILALYGLCWSVAANVTRAGWVRAAAIGSYVGAVVMAALCRDHALYLAFAGALVLLAVAPGAALVRQARAAT
ncbi:MAG TPA: hypothetical protein VGH15_00020 [Caulobacteraceae bacterium]|jgi:hypothetical protein